MGATNHFVTGVDHGDGSATKIFAFSVLCDTKLAEDEGLASDPLYREIMDFSRRFDEMKLKNKNSDISVRKLRDGEEISPKAPAQTILDTSLEEVAGDEPAWSVWETMFDGADELPNLLMKGYGVLKQIGPVIALIVCVLGLILGWHTGVCVIALVVFYENGKKTASELLRRWMRGARKGRIKRLSECLDRPLKYTLLSKPTMSEISRAGLGDYYDNDANLKIYRAFAKLAEKEGVSTPKAKEIKIDNSEIAALMTHYPKDRAGDDEVAIRAVDRKRAKVDI